MNTALVVITLLSVGTTAAVLLYAMRLLRDERERSEARVVALSDAIAASNSPAPLAREAVPAPVRPWPARRTDVDASASAPDTPRDRPAPPPSVRAGGAAALIASAPLFGAQQEQHSAGRARLLAPVAGALLVVAALGGTYVASSRSGGSSPAATAAAAPAPLELLSLRHVRKGDELTVSGVVRNPPGGRLQAHVAAVVFLFDRSGTFLASGRAPIDYQQLAAADESPFVVTVPKAGAVARYRVSFRTEHDVVPHVDRRAAERE